MPRPRIHPLPPLALGSETFGQRLARFRKQRGLTQRELGGEVGVRQSIVSDYERARLQLSAEMAVRFAYALGVTTDELLGVELHERSMDGVPDRRMMRRVRLMQRLPVKLQKVLTRTIDMFLRGLD